MDREAFNAFTAALQQLCQADQVKDHPPNYLVRFEIEKSA
jgi:hypothetical protein